MGEAVQKLSHTHDQIIDWLLAHPDQPQSRCAAEFKFTEPWLSTLIHSDLFQAKLHERQEVIFHEVALSVKDRITALAHDSLKRLHERVPGMKDEDVIATSELALKALGFTPGAGKPSVQVNNFNGNTQVVSKDVLAEARARMEGRQIAAPALIPASVVMPAAIATAERVDE